MGIAAINGRLEVWVDGNDDGLFSETDLLIHLTHNGKTSLTYADFADNFVAWRGTALGETYTGNIADNQAFALGGNDILNGNLGNDILYGGTGNDLLNGDADNDQLYGGNGADTLNGGDGSDSLNAEGLNTPTSSAVDLAGTVNILNGGAGNDNIQGGAGDDQLNGDADDDQLYGDAGSDTLNGGDGADTLDGGDGTDGLSGGAGNDTLYVGYSSAQGTFTDTLNGGDGEDVLYAGDNSSSDRGVLTGGLGADRFAFTDNGSDISNGSYYKNIVNGQYSTVAAPDRITDFNAAQSDLIRTNIGNGQVGSVPVVWRGAANAGFTATVGQSMALAGSDATDTRFLEFWTFYNSVANKTILFMDRNRDFAVDSGDLKIEFDGTIPLSTASFTEGTFAVKVGTASNDTDTNPPLSADADIAFGLGGNDALSGLDGDDTINGDSGNDTLSGGLGGDNLYGGADNDLLNGEAGTDLLYGGSGSDTLNGGDDADILGAEGANDSTNSSTGTDLAGTVNILNGGAGNDNIQGGAGDDQLNGDADDDQLYGDAGSDTLNGGDGADTLDGGDGTDGLSGGAGNDTLYVGYSSAQGTFTDTLNGGDGEDVLYAGDNSSSDRGVLTGGLGADRFAFTDNGSDISNGSYYKNIVNGQYSTVAAPDRITDFNAAQSDLIRTNIGNGQVGSVPVVWRGAANAGFTATVGQSMALAGSDATDTRFLEFWTFYNSVANKTILFMDRNRDFAVDSGDLKIEFDGTIPLSPTSFTDGTVIAKLGTSGNDTNATLPFTSVDDMLLGGRGNDSFGGGDGNDYLSGNQGDDALDGGNGGDTILGGNNNDSLAGNDGNDQLYGGSGNDTLDGGLGSDTLYAAGAQDFLNDSVSDAAGSVNQLNGGDGKDQLYGGLGNDVLHGGGDNDQLYGADGDDLLFGEGNNDNLFGDEGNDSLDGGSGKDTQSGGGGDDRIVYDSADTTIAGDEDNDVLVLTSLVTVNLASIADQVSGGGIATGFEGVDFSAIMQAVTFSGDAKDNLIIGSGFADTLSGLAGNDSLSGLAGNDTLYGGTGNDSLNGGSGADTMVGGDGSDSYIVDDAGDIVTETNILVSTGGTDIVYSGITSYTLSDNVEKLILTGTDAINGTGNTLNNVLIGNGAVNSLSGGVGNDIYVIGAGDIVVEALGEGSDTVQSSISYIVGANVENLTLTGTIAIDGTGNTLNNTLIGNAAANILDGGLGADTLVGGSGNDSYFVDNIGDVVTETSTLATEIDSVNSLISYTLSANVENLALTGVSVINGIGNALNNTLTGNTAANTLNGGLGTDTLVGDLGNDTYVVDNIGDIVTETSTLSTEIDSVNSSISYTLGTNLENLTLIGTAAINGTGNGLDNTLTGNSAVNILTGGFGNDVYFVNNIGDVVTETSTLATEIDSVNSSVSYTLGTNVESLTLTGTTAINGTGNALNNVLTGNAAANTLKGGTGADKLIGGLGNDIYVVDDAGDVVTETSILATEIDRVNSSITYSLKANVENLTLTGTTAINGTGNALNNVLTGNAAANTLNGGSGADKLIGGLGNDVYIVDDAGDVVSETSTLTTEIDRVNSSVSHALIANVENLTLTGTAAINGTGNKLHNVLTGNSGANTLKGGGGNDSLIGGLGKDNLTGGLGADKFKFNAIAETGITVSTSDIIVDFSHGQGDKIDLSAIDADTVSVGNNAFFTPTVGAIFSGVFANPGELYFDQTAHILYGNNDEDSAADFSIQLTGVSSLVAPDFVL